MNRLVIAAVSVLAVSLIVFVAISADMLGLLLFGVVLLGLISIGLSWVGVNLFSRYTEAQLKRDVVRFDHIEAMADKGYLPMGRGIAYKALPAPLFDTDIPVSVSGETASTISAYDTDAYELLVLSKKLLGENQTQIAPYHKARKDPYFADVAVWMRAVQYLLVHQMAVERYNGKRKEGTFLVAGTVGQALGKMHPPAPYLGTQN